MKQVSLKLLMIFYICIVIIGSSLYGIGSVKSKAVDGMNQMFQEEVRSAYAMVETLYTNQYPGSWKMKNDHLYKGDTLVSDTENFVDTILKKTGYYVTICTGPTRTVTNVVDEEGERAVGTKLSDQVMEEVLKDNIYSAPTDLFGKEVMSYYVPIKGVDDEIIGVFFVGVSRQSLLDVQANLTKTSVFVFLVLLIFWIPLTLVLVSHILNPIKIVCKQMQQMEQKDFSLNDKLMKIKSRSEIGQMVHSIQAMQGVIMEMTNTIHREVDQVESAAIENYQKVDEMGGNIQQIAATTEEISAGLEETSAGTETIVAIANEVMQQAKDLSVQSQQGMERSKEIAMRAQIISENTKANRENVSKLVSERKKKMEKAVVGAKQIDQIKLLADTIGGIANQTKLLALNASIEAARAGEAGRGFSVVADEIQTLSIASQNAVDKIQKLVQSIIEAVEQLIKAQEEQSQYVEESMNGLFDTLDETGMRYRDDANYMAELVSNLEVSLAKMQEDFHTLDTSIEEMKKAINEGAVGSAEIADYVSTVAGNIGTIVGVSEKTKKNTETLKEYIAQYRS